MTYFTYFVVCLHWITSIRQGIKSCLVLWPQYQKVSAYSRQLTNTPRKHQRASECWWNKWQGDSGLEHYRFHSKQCCSGCGWASEYRAVEPSDNQRISTLADKQTKQATTTKKTHTQKVVNRCLQLWSEGSSRLRPRQLGPQTALSCKEAGGQTALCRVCCPR